MECAVEQEIVKMLFVTREFRETLQSMLPSTPLISNFQVKQEVLLTYLEELDSLTNLVRSLPTKLTITTSHYNDSSVQSGKSITQSFLIRNPLTATSSTCFSVQKAQSKETATITSEQANNKNRCESKVLGKEKRSSSNAPLPTLSPVCSCCFQPVSQCQSYKNLSTVVPSEKESAELTELLNLNKQLSEENDYILKRLTEAEEKLIQLESQQQQQGIQPPRLMRCSNFQYQMKYFCNQESFYRLAEDNKKTRQQMEDLQTSLIANNEQFIQQVQKYNETIRKKDGQIETLTNTLQLLRDTIASKDKIIDRMENSRNPAAIGVISSPRSQMGGAVYNNQTNKLQSQCFSPQGLIGKMNFKNSQMKTKFFLGADKLDKVKQVGEETVLLKTTRPISGERMSALSPEAIVVGEFGKPEYTSRAKQYLKEKYEQRNRVKTMHQT